MLNMVGIAQLAERLVVVQQVAGSNPVTHPEIPVSSTQLRVEADDLTEGYLAAAKLPLPSVNAARGRSGLAVTQLH